MQEKKTINIMVFHQKLSWLSEEGNLKQLNYILRYELGLLEGNV